MNKPSLDSDDGWGIARLGNVITLKRGYDLPKQQRSDGPFPVISSSGISDYHAVAMTKGPGVVTGRYGTLGQVFYVDGDYWPLNTSLYVSDFKGNDPRFISYLLRTLDFLAYSDKAAVPGINRNHLHEAPVRIPSDVVEQRAIASVLSAFDDKIELNLKLNETLEGIARALFTSWFVKFEPVRAKFEGQTTGLLPDVEALFASGFQRNESGSSLIPAGWQEVSIYDAASVLYGAAFSSSLFNNTGAGIPLIRIRDLKDQSPQVFTSEAHPRGYLVKAGDLLVGMDGEFRPYMWAGDNGWMNQRVCCFQPKKGVSRAFIHYAIESLLLDIERSETATTVIHLGKADIDKFALLMPPEPLMRCYADVADALERRILISSRQVRTLRSLRDSLLPKLISGELRVREAERIMTKIA